MKYVCILQRKEYCRHGVRSHSFRIILKFKIEKISRNCCDQPARACANFARNAQTLQPHIVHSKHVGTAIYRSLLSLLVLLRFPPEFQECRLFLREGRAYRPIEAVHCLPCCFWLLAGWLHRVEVASTAVFAETLRPAGESRAELRRSRYITAGSGSPRPAPPHAALTLR